MLEPILEEGSDDDDEIIELWSSINDTETLNFEFDRELEHSYQEQECLSERDFACPAKRRKKEINELYNTRFRHEFNGDVDYDESRYSLEDVPETHSDAGSSSLSRSSSLIQFESLEHQLLADLQICHAGQSLHGHQKLNNFKPSIRDAYNLKLNSIPNMKQIDLSNATTYDAIDLSNILTRSARLKLCSSENSILCANSFSGSLDDFLDPFYTRNRLHYTPGGGNCDVTDTDNRIMLFAAQYQHSKSCSRLDTEGLNVCGSGGGGTQMRSSYDDDDDDDNDDHNNDHGNDHDDDLIENKRTKSFNELRLCANGTVDESNHVYNSEPKRFQSQYERLYSNGSGTASRMATAKLAPEYFQVIENEQQQREQRHQRSVCGGGGGGGVNGVNGVNGSFITSTSTSAASTNIGEQRMNSSTDSPNNKFTAINSHHNISTEYIQRISISLPDIRQHQYGNENDDDDEYNSGNGNHENNGDNEDDENGAASSSDYICENNSSIKYNRHYYDNSLNGLSTRINNRRSFNTNRKVTSHYNDFDFAASVPEGLNATPSACPFYDSVIDQYSTSSSFAAKNFDLIRLADDRVPVIISNSVRSAVVVPEPNSNRNIMSASCGNLTLLDYYMQPIKDSTRNVFPSKMNQRYLIAKNGDRLEDEFQGDRTIKTIRPKRQYISNDAVGTRSNADISDIHEFTFDRDPTNLKTNYTTSLLQFGRMESEYSAVPQQCGTKINNNDVGDAGVNDGDDQIERTSSVFVQGPPKMFVINKSSNVISTTDDLLRTETGQEAKQPLSIVVENPFEQTEQELLAELETTKRAYAMPQYNNNNNNNNNNNYRNLTDIETISSASARTPMADSLALLMPSSTNHGHLEDQKHVDDKPHVAFALNINKNDQNVNEMLRTQTIRDGGVVVVDAVASTVGTAANEPVSHLFLDNEQIINDSKNSSSSLASTFVITNRRPNGNASAQVHTHTLAHTQAHSQSSVPARVPVTELAPAPAQAQAQAQTQAPSPDHDVDQLTARRIRPSSVALISRLASTMDDSHKTVNVHSPILLNKQTTNLIANESKFGDTTVPLNITAVNKQEKKHKHSFLSRFLPFRFHMRKTKSSNPSKSVQCNSVFSGDVANVVNVSNGDFKQNDIANKHKYDSAVRTIPLKDPEEINVRDEYKIGKPEMEQVIEINNTNTNTVHIHNAKCDNVNMNMNMNDYDYNNDNDDIAIATPSNDIIIINNKIIKEEQQNTVIDNSRLPPIPQPRIVGVRPKPDPNTNNLTTIHKQMMLQQNHQQKKQQQQQQQQHHRFNNNTIHNHNINMMLLPPKAGLIETNLDTHETVITEKTKSLMDLGRQPALIDDRRYQTITECIDNQRPHKSMEFLLGKENLMTTLPPENKLQKCHDAAMVQGEHQMRFEASLKRLDVPDWFRHYNNAQPKSPLSPDVYKKARCLDNMKKSQGLYSKATSLSSLRSQQWDKSTSMLSPSTYSYANNADFSRWSTNHLHLSHTSSGGVPTNTYFCNGNSGSINNANGWPKVNPSNSAIKIPTRKPYMGWRSQEKLSKPRTPSERLASSLLTTTNVNYGPHQKPPSGRSPADMAATRSASITPTTATSGGTTPHSSNKSSVYNHKKRSLNFHSQKYWLESSFVGERTLDSAETPTFDSINAAAPTQSTTTTTPAAVSAASAAAHSAAELNDLAATTSAAIADGFHANMQKYRFKQSADATITIQTHDTPGSPAASLEDVLASLLGINSKLRRCAADDNYANETIDEPKPKPTPNQLNVLQADRLRRKSEGDARDSPANPSKRKEVKKRCHANLIAVAPPMPPPSYQQHKRSSISR